MEELREGVNGGWMGGGQMGAEEGERMQEHGSKVGITGEMNGKMEVRGEIEQLFVGKIWRG